MGDGHRTAVMRLRRLAGLPARRSRWALLVVVGVLVSLGIPSPGSAQTPPVSEGVVCNQNKTSSFVLTATTGYITTPDGDSIFMWGYAIGNNGFQYVGPILCANEGDTVTVTLKNALPVPTSLNFPGVTQVKANGATESYDSATDSIATAAAPGGSVSYSFIADHPGTFLYESGTNPQLQVLMGLVGALIVRPTKVPACPNVPTTGVTVGYVYDDCSSAYTAGREFMHMLTEVDPHMHLAIEQATCQQMYQAVANGGTLTTDTAGMLTWTPPAGSNSPVLTCTPATVADPNLRDVYDLTQYKARYFMINGRSFPDDLTPNFSTSNPTQPYGALVHISPTCPAPMMWQGATTVQCPNASATLPDGSANPDYNPLPSLVRFLNGGPVAYPFHPHGDHDSQIGLDGRVLSNPNGGAAGAAVSTSVDRFDVVVPSGQTVDVEFGWVDAQQWDPTSHDIGVAQPQEQNMVQGPYWSGSAYLGQKLPLVNGMTQWNQCGEYYHFAHSHALFQVTNYGAPGGGMLTFIRVDPPASLQKKYGTSCDGGIGYR
jgi:hypothetical protein